MRQHGYIQESRKQRAESRGKSVCATTPIEASLITSARHQDNIRTLKFKPLEQLIRSKPRESQTTRLRRRTDRVIQGSMYIPYQASPYPQEPIE
jgi:hypothetical protein